VVRTRTPPLPPSELEAALGTVLMHIQIKRLWIAQFNLLEEFDAELRRRLATLNFPENARTSGGKS
jgi:hypothetical protein